MRATGKQWFGVLAVMAVTMLLVSCSRNEPQAVQRSQPQEMDLSVRLKWLYFSNYSGAVVAKEKRFFPEQWSVTVRTGGFEADSIKMVASGTDDFGITSGIELIQARLKGVPIVALCADFQKSPVTFLTLQESGITKVEQFPGRKVGIKHGTDTELIYGALLQAVGIHQQKMTEVPVKFSTLPLIEKQVDVFPSFFMTDPVNIEAQGIALNFINPDDYGLVIYGNVLFTTERMVNSQPEVVRTFVDAYVRGWQWAVEHPEETGDIFARHNDKVPASNQVEILKRTEPFLLVDGTMTGFGQMTEAKWRATAAVLALDPEADKAALDMLDVSSIYSSSFLPSQRK
jgi:NitT/TauT family transport system substrate-binding protein